MQPRAKVTKLFSMLADIKPGSPVRLATAKTLIKEVKESKDPGLINSPGSGGDTLLMRAITTDNIEIIRSLLEAKVDVNLLNVSGASALEVAAQKGSLEVVKLLIEEKVNPDPRSFRAAAEECYVEIVKTMTEIPMLAGNLSDGKAHALSGLFNPGTIYDGDAEKFVPHPPHNPQKQMAMINLLLDGDGVSFAILKDVEALFNFLISYDGSPSEVLTNLHRMKKIPLDYTMDQKPQAISLWNNIQKSIEKMEKIAEAQCRKRESAIFTATNLATVLSQLIASYEHPAGGKKEVEKSIEQTAELLQDTGVSEFPELKNKKILTLALKEVDLYVKKINVELEQLKNTSSEYAKIKNIKFATTVNLMEKIQGWIKAGSAPHPNPFADFQKNLSESLKNKIMAGTSLFGRKPRIVQLFDILKKFDNQLECLAPEAEQKPGSTI